jgi:hypothetical protein
MSKRYQKVSGWLLGLVVSVALGFGLIVATAKPASALDCPYNGTFWQGWQPDQISCQYACESVYGRDVTGNWHQETGCCTCLF